MLIANDNYVLCAPLPDKSNDVTNLNSFFNDNKEVVKLEVVFTSKYPDQDVYLHNKLYGGDFVYVRGDFAQSTYNQNVYTLNGVSFIRVPFGEIILVESVYKKV